MISNVIISTIFFFGVFFQGCVSNQTVAHIQSDYKTLALEKFGEKSEFFPNEDTSLILCVKSFPAGKAPQVNTLKFFVYDLKERRIIHETSIVNAGIKWHSLYELEINMKHDAMSKYNTESNKKSNGYIYNVKTGVQTKLQSDKSSE